MRFLTSLVRQAVQRAANDPRVQEKAKDVYEHQIKPRAKQAWDKAKPEVEEAWRTAKPEIQKAWERTKPEVEAASKKAAEGAAKLAEDVRQRVAAASEAAKKGTGS